MGEVSYRDFVKKFSQDHPGPDLITRAAKAWKIHKGDTSDGTVTKKSVKKTSKKSSAKKSSKKSSTK
ncbi:MAG: histone, partial [Candidatus Paceibacterota bacterium]